MENNNIESLFIITPKIANKTLYYYLKTTGVDFTELRMIKFINDFKIILEEIKNEKIKKVSFLFVIDNMKLPSNFCLIKEFAEIFDEHLEHIQKKVCFSVVQTESNVFSMFFSLFKKFYKPYKPLYLCKNEHELQDIMNHPENRHNYKEIVNIIK